jgi:hypothetical protein
MKEDERTFLLDICQHAFHKKCLDPWLVRNDSCPNCRTAIDMSVPISEIDRVHLSWVICDWILRTYLSEGSFYAKKNAIRTCIQGFKWNTISSYPIDLSSLSSLRRTRAQLKEKERELTVEPSPLQSLAIRRTVRLREISEEVPLLLQQFLLR